MEKILCILFRSPEKHGEYNTSGFYYFMKTYEKLFDEVHLISLDAYNKKKQNIINKIFNIFKSIISNKPIRILNTIPKYFQNEIYKQINLIRPSVIFVEHVLLMHMIVNINKKSKIIFYNDESQLYMYEKKLLKNIKEKIKNYGLKNLECKSILKSNFIFTITYEEMKFLKKKYPEKPIYSLPFPIDLDYYNYSWKGNVREFTLLYTGTFDHYPNCAAIRFIIIKVLPLLTDLKIKLNIVGRNIHKCKIYNLNNIFLYSNVPDIRPFFRDATLFLAPIFHGAGMRIKILEAAAIGLPIIASPLANTGINLKNRTELFLAEKPKEFADKIRKIYVDNGSGLQKMSIKARNKIKKKFNIETIDNHLIKIMKDNKLV